MTTGSLFYVSKKSKVRVILITKDEFQKIIENTFRDEDREKNLSAGTGIQISGLKIKYDMTRPSMNRIVDITREDGTPIDGKQTLRIAFNGRAVKLKGSEFIEFDNPKFRGEKLEIQVYELLAEHLRKHNGIFKIMMNKRIVNINGGDVIAQDARAWEETDEEQSDG